MFVYMRWNQPPPGPRRYDVHVTAVDTQVIHYIGDLNEKKAKQLANWVIDHRKFQMPGIVRGKDKKNKKAGFITEDEFDGVREELVKRRMAETNAQNRVTLYPPAFALFRFIAGRKNERTTNELKNDGWREL
jgi:hypothetical protein